MSRYEQHAAQANEAVEGLIIQVREMLAEMTEHEAFEVLAIALQLQPRRIMTAAIFSLFRLARQPESSVTR